MHHQCIACKADPCMAPRAQGVHNYAMETLILSQDDHMKACGIRLRQLIDALSLKYVEAAADMGITPNHLGNWMRGQAYPRQYELYRFCRIRGVTTDWVYLGDPSGLPQRVASALPGLAPGPASPVARGNPVSEKI